MGIESLNKLLSTNQLIRNNVSPIGPHLIHPAWGGDMNENVP